MKNKGFSLVELIVVITILAILSTIAFVSIQGCESCENQKSAKYQIKFDGWTYYTNRYDESENCASFTDTRDRKQKICGTYQIIEK